MTDSKEVKKIADLAFLSILDQEMEEVQKNLSNILDLFQTLNDVNIQNVTPLSHPLDHQTQRLRPDQVTEPPQPDITPMAPDSKAGLFLVPPVLD